MLLLLTVGARPSSASAVLIHSYTFDGNVNDQVGSANGTLLGGATAGGFLGLNGSTAYVQFASHIVPTSGSYSVALWAQEIAPTGAFVELISQGQSGGPGFYIGHGPTGQIRVTDQWTTTGVPFPSGGGWHHYALVVDSSSNVSRLFIDGSLAGTFGAALTAGAGGTDTRFGRQFDPFAEFLNGNMDTVGIYNGALTNEEVAALAAGRDVAVPEPASLLLLGSSLVLGARRIRCRRSI